MISLFLRLSYPQNHSLLALPLSEVLPNLDMVTAFYVNYTVDLSSKHFFHDTCVNLWFTFADL